jgi:hypothetical protein
VSSVKVSVAHQPKTFGLNPYGERREFMFRNRDKNHSA